MKIKIIIFILVGILGLFVGGRYSWNLYLDTHNSRVVCHDSVFNLALGSSLVGPGKKVSKALLSGNTGILPRPFIFGENDAELLEHLDKIYSKSINSEPIGKDIMAISVYAPNFINMCSEYFYTSLRGCRNQSENLDDCFHNASNNYFELLKAAMLDANYSKVKLDLEELTMEKMVKSYKRLASGDAYVDMLRNISSEGGK